MHLKARGGVAVQPRSQNHQSLPQKRLRHLWKMGCGASAAVERTTETEGPEEIMTLNRAYHSQKGGAMRSSSQ